MSTIESKFNGYPAVTDWDKAIFLLQQANSEGFNGATKKEIFQQLFGDVVIQGAGYEDLPVAESPDPVPLPIPEADQRFGFLANGKYTQPNGPDLVYTDKQWGLVLFDNEKWVKKFTLEMPEPKGVEKIDSTTSGEKIPSVEAIRSYSVPTSSDKILPSGNSFSTFDRPDLRNMPMIDQAGKITGYLKKTSLPNKEEYDWTIIDRPDLDAVYIDKDRKILKIFSKQTSSDSNPAQKNIAGIDRPDLMSVNLDKDGKIIDQKTKESQKFGYDFLSFYNPVTAYPAFDLNTPGIVNYDQLIAAYDAVITQANNPNFTAVEKVIITKTGATGKNVYGYRLKNAKPKAKILLNAGMHAAEKMYVWVLLQMFKEIMLTPTIHPTLQWLRENCEIMFVPVVCVESLGFPELIKGSRVTPETRPFKANFSSDGTTITISYNPADFPTENNYLDKNNYFGPTPAAKKRGITVWTTNDAVNLPRGYYLYNFINGTTITIPAVTNNVASGEVYLQMWVDPNRNVDNGTGIYDAYQVSNTMFQLDDGTTYARYDSQGTKANTLKEIVEFIDHINTNKYDIVIDGHCPPAKNYCAVYKHTLLPNKEAFMSDLKRFMALFNQSSFTEEDTVLNNKGNISAGTPQWYTKTGNIFAATIEWDSGLNFASVAQVKEAATWDYTVMIAALRNFAQIR